MRLLLHTFLYLFSQAWAINLSINDTDLNKQWVDIKGPQFYLDSDAWNATTATPKSIIGQKGNKIWIYDGTKWLDSKFPDAGIKYWNISTATKNSINVLAVNGKSYYYNGLRWTQVSQKSSPSHINFDSGLLPTGESVSQTYSSGSRNPLILTTKNNLWAYTNYHWQEIDSKLLKKQPQFAITDNSNESNIVALLGSYKSSSLDSATPEILWQQIYIYDGKNWQDSKIHLQDHEYIYELNGNADKHSVIVMTSNNRLLIYNNGTWIDTNLKFENKFSMPNGAWNADTANNHSIIVGVNNMTQTKFMLYNGQQWTIIDCQNCDSGMDASYQTSIESLIIVNHKGQIYVYKDR